LQDICLPAFFQQGLCETIGQWHFQEIDPRSVQDLQALPGIAAFAGKGNQCSVFRSADNLHFEKVDYEQFFDEEDLPDCPLWQSILQRPPLVVKITASGWRTRGKSTGVSVCWHGKIMASQHSRLGMSTQVTRTKIALCSCLRRAGLRKVEFYTGGCDTNGTCNEELIAAVLTELQGTRPRAVREGKFAGVRVGVNQWKTISAESGLERYSIDWATTSLPHWRMLVEDAGGVNMYLLWESDHLAAIAMPSARLRGV